MKKVLEVRNLAKSFGGVKAVDHINFDVEEGQLLAMIGPNGAGKSTCFNLLNGQLRPDSGSVKILGQKSIGLKPREVWKLGVGRTFQVTETFPSMTVLENIQMVLLSYHKRFRSMLRLVGKLYVEEAMALLKLVGIQEQAKRPCAFLAYGDLKRVELAMALANQPKLLLMDEPTAGMGSKERIQLMELTADIVRTRSIGVLFTEHDMDVVFTHADQIIVLNRGELVAQGSPAEIHENKKVHDIYFGSGDTINIQQIKAV